MNPPSSKFFLTFVRISTRSSLILSLVFFIYWLLSALSVQAASAQIADSDQVLVPTPSVSRGFYTEPFVVALDTRTSNAEIRFTLDGSPPTPEHGLLYTGPMTIGDTTILSIVAYRADGSLRPSSHVVHTYIFLEQVLRQQGRPKRYPANWSLYPADYDMDPEIVNDPRYSPMLIDALLSIPTISLALDRRALFDDEHGIYEHPERSGVDNERATSVELIYPDNREGFQINGGLRIQGSTSRAPIKTPKHSMRLLFKSEYGKARLKFPLFAGEADAGATLVNAVRKPMDEFDTLVLRANYNNSWLHRSPRQRVRAQYLRDQLVRDTQQAMGQPAPRGFHVHLYINGLYWGLYNLHERPSAPFMSDYFGGDKPEYDVLNTGNAVDGNRAAWKQMMALAEAGLEGTQAYQQTVQMLDIENFADYMILNQFFGNTDWDDNNWYAARQRVAGARFQFFSWDAEKVMHEVDEDRMRLNEPEMPSRLFQQLMQNADFRMLFADRIYHHLFNDGALTAAQNSSRYQRLADHVADAVVAESARWGDYRRDVHKYVDRPYDLYTRGEHWVSEQQRLVERYFPQRTELVLGQYRAYGYYPLLDPPLIDHAGGLVPTRQTVTLTNPNASGAIWYTLDGTDPRPSASADRPSTGVPIGQSAVQTVAISIESTTLLKARVFDAPSGTWSALQQLSYLPPVTIGAGLAVTEIMYHPNDGEEHEFVEIANLGHQTADIGGATFSKGIEYTFPAATRLDPGGRLVVAKNPTAFARKYGFRSLNARGYRGKLDNDGETLTVRNANGEKLVSASYTDQHANQLLADGGGYALVLAESIWQTSDSQLIEDTTAASIWRLSQQRGGSPLQPDPASEIGTELIGKELVVINEVFLSTNGGSYVELYNATPKSIDISGWLLTDRLVDHAGSNLAISLPAQTVLAPYGYRLLTVEDLGIGHDPTILRGITLYLLEMDGSRPHGSAHRFQVSGVQLGYALGRCTVSSFTESHPSSIQEFVTALAIPTPGAENARPLVGPVVISELMYNPLSGDEFIELTNRSDQPVPLYDPLQPANTWRIRGVDFQFPLAKEIAPFGSLIVASVAPADFRAVSASSAEVELFGPYAGRLSDSGERIVLERPSLPQTNGAISYVEVDSVDYADAGVWPKSADGDGHSLERVQLSAFGGSVLNWQASAQADGTPGQAIHQLELERSRSTVHTSNTTALNRPTLDAPVLEYPVLEYPVLEYPVLEYPVTKIALPLVFDQQPLKQNNLCLEAAPS